MIASLVFLASVVAPAARIEALVERAPMQPSAEGRNVVDTSKQCTADMRWCLQLSQRTGNAAELTVFDATQGDRSEGWTYSIAPQPGGWRDASLRLWPQIVREVFVEDGKVSREAIDVGVVVATSTMYSGGGGQAERLTLYRLDSSGYGKPPIGDVLSLPLMGRLMIRACFSERDYEDRRGACHDTYDFDATLALDLKSRASPPRLVYQTRAVSTPGGSRRANDNGGKRLTDAELAPRIDHACSYLRIVSFNPVTERYEFDRPGPDCSDYTVP
jgi:hypothetical protein